MLSSASSLLCDCLSPFRSRVCSPVVRVDTLRSVSELWCEIGGIEMLLLGEKPLSIPLQELSTEKCPLWCHLSPTMWAHKIHCCWHCPQPWLNHGNSDNWPWCPSGSMLLKPLAQIHWHSTVEVRHRDCCSCAPGTTMGATESAQIPALLLCACAHRACSHCH